MQQILSISLEPFWKSCSARSYSSTRHFQVDSKIRTAELALSEHFSVPLRFRNDEKPFPISFLLRILKLKIAVIYLLSPEIHRFPPHRDGLKIAIVHCSKPNSKIRSFLVWPMCSFHPEKNSIPIDSDY